MTADPQRFGEYQRAIPIAKSVVTALELTEQPKDAQLKKQLLARLRDNLPDKSARWLDTCAMITEDEKNPLKFPPLMGTGGNDGNFEFSRTFMQQLQNLIDFPSGQPTDAAAKLLTAALFDRALPQLTYSGKIGQFNPIAAGGANATTGSSGDSRVNPWDFVLMMEGMLVLMPGITRRGESGQGSVAAPFTATQPSIAGYGSAVSAEKVRAELWLPLWEKPVGLGELQILFREGRAQVNKNDGKTKTRYRTARSGVDFARSVSSLGITRGIQSFHRYGFQERNGLSYFAVSLGRFITPKRPRRDPLRDLDGWLQQFNRLASGDAPAAIKRISRQLDQIMIEQAQGQADELDVLIMLGEVDKVLDQSLTYVEDKIKPMPYLRSSRWLPNMNEASAELRLALALAKENLRQRLVRVRGGRSPTWHKEKDQITTWSLGSLEQNLMSLLLRQEVEQEQQEKDSNKSSESLQNNEIHQKTLYLLPNFRDIAAWIRGDLNDELLESIARGLSLLDFSRTLVSYQQPQDNDLPAAYKLLKVVQHRQLIDDDHRCLPRVPGLISKLRADRASEALADAERRLRASDLRPRRGAATWLDGSISSFRLGAALAFPLTNKQVMDLLQQIQIPDQNSQD
jgi:CRISPR-associated protein Csx17